MAFGYMMHDIFLAFVLPGIVAIVMMITIPDSIKNLPRGNDSKSPMDEDD